MRVSGKVGIRLGSEKETVQTPKNKTSAKKNVLTVLLVLIAAAAAVAVWWLYTNPPQSRTEQNHTTISESLDSVLVTRKITNIPFMATDLDHVFYTADAVGNIVYYELANGEYTEIAPTGTMDLTVPLSGQQIPVKISYMERDGILTGFGLFTSDSAATGVYIYNFVMFKICNLPAAYAADGKCLLLAHTNQQNAYTMDTVWEEAYVLNRADGTTQRFLSENNRTLGINGAVRSDFCLITDTALTAQTAVIPFLSARGRDQSNDENAALDIYVKNGAKETLAAQNAIGRYVKPLENGAFAFIRKTDGGFETVKSENGTETVISSFYAGFGTACIRSGDWILSKEDGRVYSTYDARSYTPTGYKINPLVFAVSPDEKYIVMAGTVANALDYQIYVYNTETGKYATFNETNYAAHNNMRFLDNTTVAYYVLNVDGYENVVLDVSKIK